MRKYTTILKVIPVIVLVMLGGCASTKISQSWVEPNNTKTYDNLLIVGVAESEQNRRAWESYFVESLKEKHIDAEASYRLLGNKKINRENVSEAIKGTGIQGVIVTSLVSVDEETIYRPSVSYYPTYGAGYYGGLYSYYPHVQTYVNSPGYYSTHETYVLETNLYDVDSEELVWSARSRSFSPESVDEVIVDLTKLLIKDLEAKKLLKPEDKSEQ